MNKSELIAAVADSAGLSQADAGKAVQAFESVVTDAVKAGDKVQIPGFLTFEKSHRAARQGRNPSTGEAISIAATDVAKVSVGKKFKDAVAGR